MLLLELSCLSLLLHSMVCKQFCWPLQFTVRAKKICCSNLSKKSFIIEMIVCRGYTSLSFWKDQNFYIVSKLFPEDKCGRKYLFFNFSGWALSGLLTDRWSKKAPLPQICHTYPTIMKLGTVIHLKNFKKKTYISHKHTLWVPLTAAFFHPKSATFVI